MFYSETLLSKTGPLARVWLSANLERKLSKSHILQSNIESSVSAIVDQGQAPMALRLSGQLLLGVVRIYSRKARYLLDDCNEALLKIKMAFRPGNVDLPSNQLQPANPSALTLPDALTELDLFPAMPDASLLLTQPSALGGDLDLDRGRLGRHDDTTLLDPSDDLLSGSIEQGRNELGEKLQLEEPLVGLDIDLDFDDEPAGNDTSIHMGRNAPAPRPLEDEFSDDMNFGDNDGFKAGFGDDTLMADGAGAGADDHVHFGGDEDMDFGAGGDFGLNMDDPAPLAAPTPGRLERDSQSPLSSLRSSVERGVGGQRPHGESSMFEPHEEEEESMHQPQRVKHRKVIQPDTDTVLHSKQLRQQQEDRSEILKPASFLPRDPMLLTLEAMQRNGGFVSSILGDGRGKGWAPELRGILSLEVVRKSGELKRKRDNGIVDKGDATAPAAQKQPRLALGEEDDMLPNGDNIVVDGDASVALDQDIIDLPAVDDARVTMGDDDAGMGARIDDDDGEMSPIDDTFDHTIAPEVHPADSGPVSVGTKHAVHLLRERFDSADGSSSQQQKKSVLFHDLLPERSTSKADATKMFFEVLVLATKDAVKVEQSEEELGGPIRVRGKRGLWGSWAETGAGGEIADQDAPPASSTTAALVTA
ncbi:MAG: sister chromatid cohesion protein 1 [Piccolia ochrophora]|nr:MAG: sister chromatid cohesion protein 1 [Piccolia ochrophora]